MSEEKEEKRWRRRECTLGQESEKALGAADGGGLGLQTHTEKERRRRRRRK